MSLLVFSARLQDLLVYSVKTYSQLAEETALKRKSVYNWLKGVTYPTAESLLVLANYFQVSADYIIGLNDVEEDMPKVEVSAEEAQKSIVKHLNAYKERRNITYYRLAKLLGVGQGTMARWFKEGATPEMAILIRISKLLDKSLDELLGRR